MGRRSIIDRLDPEIRERIGDLKNAGHTLDEIMAHLKLMDLGVSRSALGRHTKRLNAMAADARRSAHMAEAIVTTYGDAPEELTQRLNIKLMHGIVTRMMISEEGDAITLDPKEAHMLSGTLRNLASASRADVLVAREAKKLRELKRRMTEAAVGAAEAQGLGEDMAESLRVAMTKVPA